jgi:hypothetical protein
VTRTGAPHYLPDFIADAFRTATGADAAFVLPSFHGIQAPLDGAIASLGPGEVTELDVIRLFAAPDYDLHVLELRPGELQEVAERYWAIADPRDEDGDRVWWNWCRMPPGISRGDGAATTVAVIRGVAGRLHEWLDRDVPAQPVGVKAADALIAALGR